MKAPDSGCRIASSAQFLCSAFAARYVYFTSQRSQVSRPGRPPHKSNFYCHPGRAGGTPMLLGCHVIGERAVDIVQVAAIAIARGMRVDDLAAVPLSFPTYEGILFNAAASIAWQLGLPV